MPDRRHVLRGAVAAAAGVAAAPADAADPKPARNGRVKQSVVVLVLQRPRREVGRREDLRGRQATRLPVGRARRPRTLADPQEARPDLRHRPERHARRAVHARVQQPQVPRRSRRAHEQDDRRLRRRQVPQRHRLHRLQVARTPTTPKSGAIPRDEAFANCVKGLKELARHAEKKGVTVCLEHLNTRDDSHPMKGHPGYQGDDLDFCADVIRKVGSPRVKLLFDIYHVQIMHGDLIRRIEQTKDLIGHVHTAGRAGPRRTRRRTRRSTTRRSCRKLVRRRVHRVRRAGVHPHPRPARRAEAGGAAVRRVTERVRGSLVPRKGGTPSQKH